MSCHRYLKRAAASLRLPWMMAVCLAVFVGADTLADIAPAPLSGGKNLTFKGNAKTKVAMVDEVVKLKLSRETCRIDVVFTMKNTGTKAETMQVGFPHEYPGEFEDFKAAVDDKPVVVKAAAESESDSSSSFSTPKRWELIYWKAWQMTFAPDKPVKIAVSYSTKLRKGSMGTVVMSPVARLILESVAKEDQPALQKRLDSRDTTYILRSKNHWSGPIGRCRIEVTFDGMTADNLTPGSLRFEQFAATVTRDKVVWDLKDYEPKDDVDLTITPEITRTAMLQLLENVQKQHPHDPSVTGTLSVYLVAAKRQPEADALMLGLLKHWQDKITILGRESGRGQSLQQALQFLESESVLRMIHRKIDKEQNPAEFQNPSQFAPVIERIALRVQDQLKFLPPNQADRTKDYVEQIDKMLKWSQTHAKP